MPSNADLIAAIGALAAELDVEVVTDGLNNDKLSALKADLLAKKKDKENDTQADQAMLDAEAKKADEKAPTKKPPYYVAPRNAIACKKGILSGDTEDEVKAEYLDGGQATLDAFVKSGHILKG